MDDLGTCSRTTATQHDIVTAHHITAQRSTSQQLLRRHLMVELQSMKQLLLRWKAFAAA
jgi:hypothetical protein